MADAVKDEDEIDGKKPIDVDVEHETKLLGPIISGAYLSALAYTTFIGPLALGAVTITAPLLITIGAFAAVGFVLWKMAESILGHDKKTSEDFAKKKIKENDGDVAAGKEWARSDEWKLLGWYGRHRARLARLKKVNKDLKKLRTLEKETYETIENKYKGRLNKLKIGVASGAAVTGATAIFHTVGGAAGLVGMFTAGAVPFLPLLGVAAIAVALFFVAKHISKKLEEGNDRKIVTKKAELDSVRGRAMIPVLEAELERLKDEEKADLQAEIDKDLLSRKELKADEDSVGSIKNLRRQLSELDPSDEDYNRKKRALEEKLQNAEDKLEAINGRIGEHGSLTKKMEELDESIEALDRDLRRARNGAKPNKEGKVYETDFANEKEDEILPDEEGGVQLSEGHRELLKEKTNLEEKAGSNWLTKRVRGLASAFRGAAEDFKDFITGDRFSEERRDAEVRAKQREREALKKEIQDDIRSDAPAHT